MTGAEPPVLVEQLDGILTVTLNRTHVRNAVDAATAGIACRAFAAFEADASMRVAIITGAGGTFCAGMDLKAFLATGESARIEPRGFLGLTDHRFAKPIIAAVEGFARGGGFETVIACDLVVASTTATFAIMEVRRGLAAGSGGLHRLPRKIPMNIAMELALTGEPIDATRAAQLGLVNRLTEPGGALAEALRLARTIAGNAPLAVAASKAVVVGQQDWSVAETAERQAAIIGDLRSSNDAREGARAFAEKRPPRWTGS